jgi:general secretion pathway protein I
MIFNKSSIQARGFTLLEVLVALTIITITMGGLLQSVSVITRNESDLHTKKLLSWAAQNQLVKIQLAGDSIAAGKTAGESEMSGQKIDWSADIMTTSNPELLKVVVSTQLNQMSHSLYGYVAKKTVITQ